MTSNSSLSRVGRSQTLHHSDCAACLIRSAINDPSYTSYLVDSARRYAPECTTCRSLVRRATR
ncbi:hypothetical protein NEOLEDRAFT_1138808 [Neolentinus lepideus HHB14362 ss-1]|uniref:Uncharacterized protein n=1 Tax=Neolentinus lepideus HHB14362 ss-1 TaxID=1314782 RepID=A0A165Q292_9AGAM|nr:hypothetical protein NEOLEDRAFT_1138808 [Neolentinus lepideus HHB14362 ss-1]